jgi:hypothetical protein
MRNERSLLGRLSTTQAISLGLIAIVGIIIVIARILPHSSDDSLVRDGGPSIVGTSASGLPAGGDALPTALPTAPPSGPLLYSPVPPVTKKGSPTPQSVAKSFGKAWLHHDGVTPAAWLQGVSAYTTSALATQLASTNPANVPANEVTGAVTIVDDAADACGANVPTDTGTLVLTMQRVANRWLVSAVDWNRS